MKIFMSQPMNGRTEEEVFEEREKYIEIFKAENPMFENAELIDNYHKPHAPENPTRLWFLGDSLQLMGTSDVVVFVPGWRKSNGCRVEMFCCKVYKIPYIKMHKV